MPLQAASQCSISGGEMKRDIVLRINRKSYTLNVETHRTLVEVLRETLGFTGTKKSCSEGECAPAPS